MEFRERSLEASSLFLCAELLELNAVGGFIPGSRVKVAAEHITRIRAVATRLCLEVEEGRLRRDIEGEHYEKPGPGHYFLVDRSVADRFRLGGAQPADQSSNGSADSDAVALKRYLELDQCLEQ